MSNKGKGVPLLKPAPHHEDKQRRRDIASNILNLTINGGKW
jgi:hypothetical protein